MKEVITYLGRVGSGSLLTYHKASIPFVGNHLISVITNIPT
jgi:hypothetical protein